MMTRMMTRMMTKMMMCAGCQNVLCHTLYSDLLLPCRQCVTHARSQELQHTATLCNTLQLTVFYCIASCVYSHTLHTCSKKVSGSLMLTVSINMMWCKIVPHPFKGRRKMCVCSGASLLSYKHTHIHTHAHEHTRTHISRGCKRCASAPAPWCGADDVCQTSSSVTSLLNFQCRIIPALTCEDFRVIWRSRRQLYGDGI